MILSIKRLACTFGIADLLDHSFCGALVYWKATCTLSSQPQSCIMFWVGESSFDY